MDLRFPARFLPCLALSVLLACSDGTAPGLRGGPVLQVVSGNTQSAAAGAELPDPVVVQVTDSSGAIVVGQIVNFQVTSGNGSVFAGTAISNSAGLAQERWTVGTTAGQSQQLEARAVDPATGTRQTFAVFNATVTAGPAASLTKISGDSQVGVLNVALAESVVVVVRDQFGNPVAGDSVIWTASAANGALSPARTVTNVAGQAAARWTLGATQSSDTALAGLKANASLQMTFVADAAFPFLQLASGHAHTCGLAADSTAYCWGHNTFGELGSGDTLRSSRPRAVAGGHRFKSIAARSESTCAIAADNSAWCWGRNDHGQLGNGTVVPYPQPGAMTPAAVLGGHTFAQLSVNQEHACGIDLSGSAWCWGGNGTGALGTADTVSRTSPASVTGGLLFTAISAGGAHTCALTGAGLGYCWGTNTFGQFGNGGSSPLPDGTPRLVAGGLAFASLSAGGNGTCGRTAANVGYCWGTNQQSALGTGTGDVNVPTPISGGLQFAYLEISSIFSCGFTPAGRAYCWGENTDGQIGGLPPGGTLGTPQAVPGTLVFTQLSMGASNHVCGLTTPGVAYCWGGNNWGQVGDGTTGNGNALPRLIPTRVLSP